MNERPTNSNRFASGRAFTNSQMFPPTIQSDTIANRPSDIVTPLSCRIFGCERAFHITASLQNLCKRALSVHGHAERWHNQKLTPMILLRSLVVYVLMTFTATSRPQCFPFHTSANPPLYNATPVLSYQTETSNRFGRRAWPPHVLYNDLRHFFRVRGKSSRVSSAWSTERSDVNSNQRNHNGR